MPDTFFPPPTPPPPPPLPVAPPPFVPVPPPPQPRLELRDLEAFLLLDGPQRDDLGRPAQVSILAPNDEVTGFALALVLKGQVNVAATVAEAPAMRAHPGELVRSGGTATDQVKIRLVPVGDDVEIATWTDEDVSRVLASAPAFATQLGELADHIQVRVGVALGPLGERLDFALRTEIVDRLETRHLKEGDVVVRRRQAGPGDDRRRRRQSRAGRRHHHHAGCQPGRVPLRGPRSSAAAPRRTPRALAAEAPPSSSVDACSRRSSW